METIGMVLKILSTILSIACYGVYLCFYRKKDYYQAIKFLVLGAIMQNLTLHLK